MTIKCSDEDPIFMRNHYPRRTVLGIIARDGAMAEFTSLPPANLHEVPEGITDEEAAFAEPLAAACRVLEQQVQSLYCICSIDQGGHAFILLLCGIV